MSSERVAAVLALSLLSLAAPRPGLAEPGAQRLEIAPLEADLESMRDVLRQLEEVVNARAPEQAAGLISPRATDDQRRSILAAVEHLCDAMPPEARYHLRSDLGRSALVPLGDARVQLQVRGVRVVGDERTRGSVQLHLEPVESGGRRRWMLTHLDLPGQGFALPSGRQTWLPAAGGLAGVALLALVLVTLLRRRRRQRAGA